MSPTNLMGNVARSSAMQAALQEYKAAGGNDLVGRENLSSEHNNKHIQQELKSSGQSFANTDPEQHKDLNKNNVSHQDRVSLSSAGKQAAQSDLTQDEQKHVQTLKDRDREVKVHEQAHAAVGGQYAGSPSYEYETGPDGKRYVVGGEVSIDVSEEEMPEDTVQKMQIVRAAALAPAEPSTQDLKVAAQASQQESQARAQLSQNKMSDTTAENGNNTQKSGIPQQTELALAYSEMNANRAVSSFSVNA